MDSNQTTSATVLLDSTKKIINTVTIVQKCEY
nr:MAG TPA: hypothetical protein [Caudoviricetes sp.]